MEAEMESEEEYDPLINLVTGKGFRVGIKKWGQVTCLICEGCNESDDCRKIK